MDAADKLDAAQRRYFKTEKGKRALKKYAQSEKGKGALRDAQKRHYDKTKREKELAEACRLFLAADPGKTVADFLKENVQNDE